VASTDFATGLLPGRSDEILGETASLLMSAIPRGLSRHPSDSDPSHARSAGEVYVLRAASSGTSGATGRWARSSETHTL
jgi:hypothetical protein